MPNVKKETSARRCDTTVDPRAWREGIMSESTAQPNSRSTIVVGVDGSGPSIAALRWAIDLAHQDDLSIEAITVWRSEPLFARPAGQFLPYGQVKRDHVAMLATAVAKVRDRHPDVDIRQVVLDGDAAELLTEHAADARLLVVGSHGHGKIATTFLGSCSAECVRLATCPVVVIPIAIARDADIPATEGSHPAAVTTPDPQP